MKVNDVEEIYDSLGCLADKVENLETTIGFIVENISHSNATEKEITSIMGSLKIIAGAIRLEIDSLQDDIWSRSKAIN